jgi:hypothetical protein
VRLEGKLINSGGEFIACGPCEINRERAEVTMWPSWELHMLARERGALTLELDDGRTLMISDRHLTFRMKTDTEPRMSVYRLRILEQVPEHLQAGYAEQDPADEALMQQVREDEASRAGHAPERARQ